MISPIDNRADFYVVGGTMNPEAPSYIERNADNELYEHILRGDFCCVLTPRQMGKSSLMARTANRLKKTGIRTAILDLTRIGTEKARDAAEKWYYGITHSIARELGLNTNLSAWWRDREKLPALQRMTEFFEDILLPGTTGPVVIFVDEIDTTIALPFTDDFFAAVRACYNVRATKTDYRRLNFVLLGVAGPADLIKDSRRTPFNIGYRIRLTDFTPGEAQPLARGLCTDPVQASEMLKRILYWTGGHPYLTQKLCSLAAREKMEIYSEARIDAVVEKHFLLPGVSREESNLKFVSQRLLQNKRTGRKLLLLYRQIYLGKTIVDDPLSPIHSGLKLSGLVVSREEHRLCIRNCIYENIFTKDWIKEVIPNDWSKNIAVVLFLLLLSSYAVFYTIFLPMQYNKIIRTSENDVPISAYEKLRMLPGYEKKADDLFADYWDRRALRSLSEKKLDEGLLYRLKALTVKDTQDRRGEAAEVIGDDYVNLLATFRYNRSVTSVAFGPNGKFVLTGSADNTAKLWDAASGKPLTPSIKFDSRFSSVAFSPDGKAIIAATDWWAHQGIITGDTIKPKASRILPGQWLNAYRFLDDKGDRMQVVVRVTANSIKIIELRFDRPTAPPIQGDPIKLLERWQKKLALKLDEKTGKIEPMYPLPKALELNDKR